MASHSFLPSKLYSAWTMGGEDAIVVGNNQGGGTDKCCITADAKKRPNIGLLQQQPRLSCAGRLKY